MMKSMFRLSCHTFVIKEVQSLIQFCVAPESLLLTALVQSGTSTYSCRIMTSANTVSFLATAAKYAILLYSMAFCMHTWRVGYRTLC